MQELSGAGGNWRVIDEIVDANVVQQQDNLSCGPACGEMLLKNRGINDIDRYAIASESGVPVSPQVLASVLNALNSTSSDRWVGAPLSIPGASDIQLIEVLNTTGSWAAMLWEPQTTIGHMIIVDGFDDEERILIRDPWAGTKYKMDIEEFLNYWTLFAVYRAG
jgi:ABC-type bacteriocin/lantibiotic exporter with double-glycine peptidase domain